MKPRRSSRLTTMLGSRERRAIRCLKQQVFDFLLPTLDGYRFPDFTKLQMGPTPSSNSRTILYVIYRCDHAGEIVEIAVAAGDTIPEGLVKIQRPLSICAAMTVRFHDDRYCPLCQLERYGLRSIGACEHRAQHLRCHRGPRQRCVSSRRTDDTRLYPESFRITGLDLHRRPSSV